ncbi:MAG: alanine dehydrogenase [Bacillota bacterium]
MIIGVPKEIKESENRVALTPAGVKALCIDGHRVIIEAGAGMGSGIEDQEFRAAGAELLDNAGSVYSQAEMVIKVKEPLRQEYAFLRPGMIMFAYLHLAADFALTRELRDKKVVAIAYETIQAVDRSLPLLMPMSEVAGRMAVQVGAQFLEQPNGGRGVLLSGVPGVPPANVVIIGAGTVGTNAAKIAVGMGAYVTVLDVDAGRLRHLDDLFGGRVQTVMSNQFNLHRAACYADLLIGAVLIPGAKAPHLITEEMVKEMRTGSVIVDVAVDQGGCVETVDHATTHKEPTYVKYGVIHYAVANIPGAVPRTATFALTNTTLPYILEIAHKGYRRAIVENPALAKGVNTLEGRITYEAVSRAWDQEYTPLAQVLDEL